MEAEHVCTAAYLKFIYVKKWVLIPICEDIVMTSLHVFSKRKIQNTGTSFLGSMILNVKDQIRTKIK